LIGAGSVLAYVGSVCWLYEKPDFGMAALVGIAGIDLLAAWFAGGAFSYWYGDGTAHVISSASVAAWLLVCLDPVTSGLVTGVTIAAMLLGHWYLNSPTMELNPLKRLIRLLMAVAVLRAIVCAIGLAVLWAMTGPPANLSLWFFALRWLSGVFGLLGLAWMALRTLDIPNTQSATGILYVAVIAAFTGELCGQLLSHGALYPL
ncbi:MAG: hypothetical protein K8T25_04245, partial [Planctomycetia bacterium]|nr:hypothetical protein [Planctomycetia bacterium]